MRDGRERLQRRSPAICPTGQPSTATSGFNNFWALTMNSVGQVAQATCMAQVSPPPGDTFQIVSSGSASVVIEVLNSLGAVDTSAATQTALGPYGFSNGYLTVTHGAAFSGVSARTYLGFGGVYANDLVNLYFVAAPQYSATGTSTAVTLSYAIVDTYRWRERLTDRIRVGAPRKGRPFARRRQQEAPWGGRGSPGGPAAARAREAAGTPPQRDHRTRAR